MGKIALNHSIFLDSIDFNLDVIASKEANKKASDDKKWNAMFSQLEQYQQDHGDCNVPRKEGKLGKWFSTQRTWDKKNKLTEEQKARLNNNCFRFLPKENT